MDIKKFDYDLPRELIAQQKSQPRDASRLFHIDAGTGRYSHLRFCDIANKLDREDILVLNRSRVIPARIKATKETGGKAEVLLLERSGERSWDALAGGKNIKEGSILLTDDDVKIRVKRRFHEGYCQVDLLREKQPLSHEETLEWLRDWGLMPTPPYIRRMLSDPEEYQTVYGDIEGSVAAPTAGLHFTNDLLDRIRARGVKVVFIMLHVGIGTFAPVKENDIMAHVMEEEEFMIPNDVVRILRDAVKDNEKNGNRRIWAVGTTVMRALETAFDKEGGIVRSGGKTGLYITPGHEFHLPYKGFITNFHLPRSTPLILVSTFYDREKILSAYEVAKKMGYRFYSLGDSMMIRRG